MKCFIVLAFLAVAVVAPDPEPAPAEKKETCNMSKFQLEQIEKIPSRLNADKCKRGADELMRQRNAFANARNRELAKPAKDMQQSEVERYNAEIAKFDDPDVIDASEKKCVELYNKAKLVVGPRTCQTAIRKVP
jgi:hypothetical protein